MHSSYLGVWLLAVVPLAGQDLLSVDEAVRRALANHPLLAAQTERIAAAEGLVQQAKGNLAQSEADLEFARKQVALLQAEANLAVAQANLVKAQQVLSDGAVSSDLLVLVAIVVGTVGYALVRFPRRDLAAPS